VERRWCPARFSLHLDHSPSAPMIRSAAYVSPNSVCTTSSFGSRLATRMPSRTSIPKADRFPMKHPLHVDFCGHPFYNVATSLGNISASSLYRNAFQPYCAGLNHLCNCTLASVSKSSSSFSRNSPCPRFTMGDIVVKMLWSDD
jgi:hypothetical protein